LYSGEERGYKSAALDEEFRIASGNNTESSTGEKNAQFTHFSQANSVSDFEFIAKSMNGKSLNCKETARPREARKPNPGSRAV
jgi:hypothetical protein